MAPSRTVQPQAPQAARNSRRAPRRKRISAIHRGALVALDAAVEARQDTEQVSADYEIRREDVQDAFAWTTRLMLRKLEGIQRDFAARLVEVDALLGGETRPARKGGGRAA